MRKYALLMCLLPALSIAKPESVICNHRLPTGIKAEYVTLKILPMPNQTYTAHLDIRSWDNKPVASETITDLACYFSTQIFPVVRCHHRSTESYALSISSVSTTSIGHILDPSGSLPQVIDVVKNEFSATMDAPRDNYEHIPYGYGEILFSPDECTRS
jgi:hypothetical protein